MAERTLKENVYNQIMNLIITGDIKAGSIISEKELIERFSVSKSPVREAMLELCKDGILTSIPRCGYQVSQMSSKSLTEIVDARLIIELANFKNICEKVTNQQIDSTFAKESKTIKIKGKTVLDAANNNASFHLKLVMMSGNKILTDFLKRLLELYSISYAQLYTAIPSIISPSENHNHDLFLDAWKKRDYKKAEEYLRNDIITSLKEMQYLSF